MWTAQQLVTKPFIIFSNNIMNTKILQLCDVTDNDFREFYRTKVIAKKGIEFYLIPVSNITYFYCENRITYLKDHSGNKFIVEKPLT